MPPREKEGLMGEFRGQDLQAKGAAPDWLSLRPASPSLLPRKPGLQPFSKWKGPKSVQAQDGGRLGSSVCAS